MSILDDSTQWADPEGTRPPPQWNGTAWNFTALSVYAPDDDPPTAGSIIYAGDAPLPASLTFNLTFPVAAAGAELFLGFSIDDVFMELEEIDGVSAVTIDIPEGSTEFAWEVFAFEPTAEDAPSPPYTSGTIRVIGDDVDPPEIGFNCECDEETAERTLADMRVSLLRRLGFSAQVDNPPPGMAELLDDFLRDAQEQLYMRYACFRTERFFRWLVQPGVRYYSVAANADVCDKKLNTYRISWVGIQDHNNSWTDLICGIPPMFYTSVDFMRRPTHYEARDCIELFPTPDDYYTLRIKGHLGLLPFTEDEDQCTIDSHAVFLLALANAKTHYRQPADNVFAQSNSYNGSLVAGSHHTRRYVPRTTQRPPMTRPRMVAFDDE